MPISTNAPFNEFGQSQILRDIEQLYLALNAIGTGSSGDGQTQDQSSANTGETGPTAEITGSGGGGPGPAGPAGEPGVCSVQVGSGFTANTVYYRSVGSVAWAALDGSIGERAAVALCTESDGSTATLLINGKFARSGTPGDTLFVSYGGAITTTYPGDEDSEDTSAVWVWQIGVQVTSTEASISPCDPYRPRRISYCGTDGTTQVVIVTREYPEDP
jgi:hypothetical protein